VKLFTALRDERRHSVGDRQYRSRGTGTKIRLKALIVGAVTRMSAGRLQRIPGLEGYDMPAQLSELELSDLDFTDTVVMRGSETNEAADPTDRVLKQLDTIVDSIALKVELGSTDERLWRILAGVYLALERIADYGDLVRKHLALFGHPLQLDQPAVTYSLPVKVNFDDVPKLDMIRSACAAPGGAVIDFSAVRRLSAGGLIALSELLGALIQMSELPQLRGMDAFIGSIEGAIKAGQGTREMQELIATYRRYQVAHPRLQDERCIVAA